MSPQETGLTMTLCASLARNDSKANIDICQHADEPINLAGCFVDEKIKTPFTSSAVPAVQKSKANHRLNVKEVKMRVTFIALLT